MTQPFNPRLSDFSEEQLRLLVEMSLQKSADNSGQIQAYRDRGVEDMFWTEIQKLKNETADVMELFVQFAGALKAKQAERIVNSN